MAKSIRLRLIMPVFAVLLFSAMVTSGRAQSLEDYDSGAAGRGNGHLLPWVVVGQVALGAPVCTWTISLNPVPAVGIHLTVAEFDRLTAAFPPPPAAPGWTFTLKGLVAPGEFPGERRVVRYDPAEHNSLTGAWNPALDFLVEYHPAAGVVLPAGHVWQWIQFVITTHPTPAGAGAAGTASGVPYIDAYDYDWNIPAGSSNSGTMGLSDGTPFYWNDTGNSERAANSGLAGGVAIRFTDRPWRFLSQVAIGAVLTWEAHLYLIDYDPATHTVCIDNMRGIDWGFTISRVQVGVMPPAGAQWDSGGAGGDKYDGGWGTPINATVASGAVNVTVGGFSFLTVHAPSLASWFAYCSITATVTIGAVYIRRRLPKKRQQ